MGEAAGLKVPTKQAMSPPISPTSTSGPRNSGCAQAKAPAPRQSNSRMPVLLITPCNVMAPARSHVWEKASVRLRSGFDVSIFQDPARTGLKLRVKNFDELLTKPSSGLTWSARTGVVWFKQRVLNYGNDHISQAERNAGG